MKAKRTKQTVIIITGSILAAYGITLALSAGFGGATLAVLWQGISATCSISLGWASFAVALAMIAFVFFYDRSQIHIGTILYQVIYSVFVDVFAKIHPSGMGFWQSVFLMILGVVIFAVGTGLYASAEWGRGSYEALTFSLAEKNHWQVRTVRMVLDVLFVVIGVLLGGQFGACTIVTVLLSGPIIQYIAKKSKQLFHF